MKYHIDYSGKFKKGLKKCYKRGLNVELLRAIIKSLEETGTVSAEHRPISCQVIMPVVGNAIFRGIGCLYGSKTMRD